jgi:hypothetical protein
MANFIELTQVIEASTQTRVIMVNVDNIVFFYDHRIILKDNRRINIKESYDEIEMLIGVNNAILRRIKQTI